MTYLTRGPSLLGIGSNGHPSTEPTPFFAQIVDATGGDGMSPLSVSASRSHDMQLQMRAHAHAFTSFSRFQTTPQAAP
jgi:hypothetical protein